MSLSKERRLLVDKARTAWIKRLIDSSRRNNLLFFKHLKSSTLDLSTCNPAALKMFWEGDSVSSGDLLPESDPIQTSAILKEVRRRSISNLEEKGLQTLYMAVGMATWEAIDGGTPPHSPIALVPVEIKPKGREGRYFSFTKSGDVQVNLVLLHVLNEWFKIQINPEDLLEGVNDDGLFDPAVMFRKLRESAKGIKSFSIIQEMAIGNFSFQKMSMVKDIREHGVEIALNDLLAALAGDIDARAALLSSREEIDGRELDQIHPRDEYLFLDADSSQQKVIAAVTNGQHGVIQGAPGTGKSQTIANLIATLVAQGKKVLFVAEKRAALEVVLRRLQDRKLGHLALDLHGADVSQKKVMKQVADCLMAVRNSKEVEFESEFDRLIELRERLNEHAEVMNKKREPSEKDIFDLQGEILRIPSTAQSSTRWDKKQLGSLRPPVVRSILDLLTEAQGLNHLFLLDDLSPWNGALLRDGGMVQEAIALTSQLHSELLPKLDSTLTRICDALQLLIPRTPLELKAFVETVRDAQGCLAVYSKDIFELDLNTLVKELDPLNGFLSKIWAYATSRTFRSAVRKVRGLRMVGNVTARGLFEEIQRARITQGKWKKWAQEKNQPVDVEGMSDLLKLADEFQLSVTRMSGFFPFRQPHIAELPFLEMKTYFKDAVKDKTTAHRLPRMWEIEKTLTSLGVEGITKEIRDNKPPVNLWSTIFQHAWLSSCLDAERITDNIIAGFSGDTHGKFVAEFKELDKKRLVVAAARVRHAHAQNAVSVMNSFPQQAALVRREAEKKARHLSLRRLLADAPDVLTAVCPCWMASPLSISQVLDAQKRYFDVVIFDEASQVLPEDAVPALMRASQVVVAGDKHQLPPTTFFMADNDDVDEENFSDATGGFESILDQMSAFMDPWWLEWHYRSLDERLIAFSNRHIYKDVLVTFPNPIRGKVIFHALVKQSWTGDIEQESSSAEVEEVTRLILRHAEERPGESLGVIALGIKHSKRLEAAFEKAVLLRPDLDVFFDQSKSERFFIKNLERVQGDERDAIIISVGYGKDRSGKLLYRFGPLLYSGGERRLNVAVTRARRRVTLVSSFSHHEMDPSKTHSRGVELLRLYLQYASSEGSMLDDQGSLDVQLNPFELDVMEALAKKGVKLLPQYGVSRYRIDLVVQHPKQPGRFVMAVECDGASYHSSPTACERDRLRQQHLEALGWHFYRIWSTDWFMRRQEEINRFMKAYQSSLRKDSQPSEQGNTAWDRHNAQHHEDADSASENVEFRFKSRGPRPLLKKGLRIDQYASRLLLNLVTWIQSDGQIRTDEQILVEMISELGFSRRGEKIEKYLRSAIAQFHGAFSHNGPK